MWCMLGSEGGREAAREWKHSRREWDGERERLCGFITQQAGSACRFTPFHAFPFHYSLLSLPVLPLCPSHLFTPFLLSPFLPPPPSVTQAGTYYLHVDIWWKFHNALKRRLRQCPPDDVSLRLAASPHFCLHFWGCVIVMRKKFQKFKAIQTLLETFRAHLELNQHSNWKLVWFRTALLWLVIQNNDGRTFHIFIYFSSIFFFLPSGLKVARRGQRFAGPVQRTSWWFNYIRLGRPGRWILYCRQVLTCKSSLVVSQESGRPWWGQTETRVAAGMEGWIVVRWREAKQGGMSLLWWTEGLKDWRNAGNKWSNWWW